MINFSTIIEKFAFLNIIPLLCFQYHTRPTYDIPLIWFLYLLWSSFLLKLSIQKVKKDKSPIKKKWWRINVCFSSLKDMTQQWKTFFFKIDFWKTIILFIPIWVITVKSLKFFCFFRAFLLEDIFLVDLIFLMSSLMSKIHNMNSILIFLDLLQEWS